MGNKAASLTTKTKLAPDAALSLKPGVLLASSYLLSCEFSYKEVGISSRQLHHFAELLRRAMSLCSLTC
jgi:hypothetical protein